MTVQIRKEGVSNKQKYYYHSPAFCFPCTILFLSEWSQVLVYGLDIARFWVHCNFQTLWPSLWEFCLPFRCRFSSSTSWKNLTGILLPQRTYPPCVLRIVSPNTHPKRWKALESWARPLSVILLYLLKNVWIPWANTPLFCNSLCNILRKFLYLLHKIIDVNGRSARARRLGTAAQWGRRRLFSCLRAAHEATAWRLMPMFDLWPQSLQIWSPNSPPSPIKIRLPLVSIHD